MTMAVGEMAAAGTMTIIGMAAAGRAIGITVGIGAIIRRRRFIMCRHRRFTTPRPRQCITRRHLITMPHLAIRLGGIAPGPAGPV